MEANHTQTVQGTERKMDCELTVDEINRLHVLAIRERARTNDRDLDTVNLARKMLEFKRRAET